MDQSTKNETLRNINRLEELNASSVDIGESARIAIGLVELILRPLLAEEGYTTRPVTLDGTRDLGIDLLAQRRGSQGYDECRIGITHKYFKQGRTIDISEVENSLAFLIGSGLSRAMLIVNTGIADRVRDDTRRMGAAAVELLDINGLRAWVSRIDIETDIDKLEIEQIMKVMSNRFAALIAEDPRNLDKLEWRQIEFLVADIFDGLGFRVTLTPASKDGGKDVILECTVEGRERTYIVEIKHWRSGKAVGNGCVKDFLGVLVREKRDGGLFLSTYGYANDAFESLTEIERKTLRFGDEDKIAALCRTYKKIQSGILSPPSKITEIITDGTL